MQSITWGLCCVPKWFCDHICCPKHDSHKEADVSADIAPEVLFAREVSCSHPHQTAIGEASLSTHIWIELHSDIQGASHPRTEALSRRSEETPKTSHEAAAVPLSAFDLFGHVRQCCVRCSLGPNQKNDGEMVAGINEIVCRQLVDAVSNYDVPGTEECQNCTEHGLGCEMMQSARLNALSCMSCAPMCQQHCKHSQTYYGAPQWDAAASCCKVAESPLLDAAAVAYAAAAADVAGVTERFVAFMA